MQETRKWIEGLIQILLILPPEITCWIMCWSYF